MRFSYIPTIILAFLLQLTISTFVAAQQGSEPITPDTTRADLDRILTQEAQQLDIVKRHGDLMSAMSRLNNGELTQLLEQYGFPPPNSNELEELFERSLANQKNFTAGKSTRLKTIEDWIIEKIRDETNPQLILGWESRKERLERLKAVHKALQRFNRLSETFAEQFFSEARSDKRQRQSETERANSDSSDLSLNSMQLMFVQKKSAEEADDHRGQAPLEFESAALAEFSRLQFELQKRYEAFAEPSGLISGESLRHNHYLFYTVRHRRLPEPASILVQSPLDSEAFETAVNAIVRVATPVRKNDEPLFNDKAHLAWFQINTSLKAPPREFCMENQFGVSRFRTGDSPTGLLVPSEKVERGSEFPEGIDHYLVFRAEKPEEFDPSVLIDIEDQFQKRKNIVRDRIAYLAIPITKVHGKNRFEIVAEENWIVVYNIADRKSVEEHRDIVNQFGRLREIEFQVPDLIAVPSSVIYWYEVGEQ